MKNNPLFLSISYLQKKHSRKRGMPKPAAPPKPASTIHTADLTQVIIKYIRARGGYAVRINCFGTYDRKANRWHKSTTARGTADIHACFDGCHLSIEVKNGTDRQSDAQKQGEEQVVNSGGFYLIVSDFSAFHSWFQEFKARHR